MAYKHLATLFVAILEEVIYPNSYDPIAEFCIDFMTVIGLVMVIVFTLQAIF